MWDTKPKGKWEDVRDAIVNYAVDIAGIPIAQELETTPESIGLASMGDYAGKGGRYSRHITEEIEPGLISDDERTAEERWG